jgi:hypothetical protein
VAQGPAITRASKSRSEEHLLGGMMIRDIDIRAKRTSKAGAMIAMASCLAACAPVAITPGMLQAPSSIRPYLCKDALKRTAIFTKKCPDEYKLVEKRT